MSTIRADQGLSAEIQKILSEVKDDVELTTDKVLNDTAKNCAKELKSTSPVGKGPHAGRYAKGWSVKKDSNLKGICKIGNYTVHNRTDWQLTHLLENGHVIRNQYGEYGRVEARPHIANAEQAAINKCLSDLEGELK